MKYGVVENSVEVQRTVPKPDRHSMSMMTADIIGQEVDDCMTIELEREIAYL